MYMRKQNEFLQLNNAPEKKNNFDLQQESEYDFHREFEDYVEGLQKQYPIENLTYRTGEADGYTFTIGQNEYVSEFAGGGGMGKVFRAENVDNPDDILILKAIYPGVNGFGKNQFREGINLNRGRNFNREVLPELKGVFYNDIGNTGRFQLFLVMTYEGKDGAKKENLNILENLERFYHVFKHSLPEVFEREFQAPYQAIVESFQGGFPPTPDVARMYSSIQSFFDAKFLYILQNKLSQEEYKSFYKSFFEMFDIREEYLKFYFHQGQLARHLQAMHSGCEFEALYHLDLKPHNITIDENEIVRVIDPGLGVISQGVDMTYLPETIQNKTARKYIKNKLYGENLAKRRIEKSLDYDDYLNGLIGTLNFIHPKRYYRSFDNEYQELSAKNFNIEQKPDSEDDNFAYLVIVVNRFLKENNLPQLPNFFNNLQMGRNQNNFAFRKNLFEMFAQELAYITVKVKQDKGPDGVIWEEQLFFSESMRKVLFPGRLDYASDVPLAEQLTLLQVNTTDLWAEMKERFDHIMVDSESYSENMFHLNEQFEKLQNIEDISTLETLYRISEDVIHFPHHTVEDLAEIIEKELNQNMLDLRSLKFRFRNNPSKADEIYQGYITKVIQLIKDKKNKKRVFDFKELEEYVSFERALRVMVSVNVTDDNIRDIAKKMLGRVGFGEDSLLLENSSEKFVEKKLQERVDVLIDLFRFEMSGR